MKRTIGGFTLIELMIVMAILGILLVIGSNVFLNSLKKGRDTTRKGNLVAIGNALELYYNDKGEYPAGSNGTIGNCYTVGGSGPGTCGSDYPVFKDSIANGALYMQKFPVDPMAGQQYYYVSNKKQYQLYAHLENSQDPQAVITPAASGTTCGTGIGCNYGISSANTNP